MIVRRIVYFLNSFLRIANGETQSPLAMSAVQVYEVFARKEGRSSLLFLHFRDEVGRDEL